MPNHVTSVCTVTGPAADIAAFYEKHVAPGYPERVKSRKPDSGPAFTCDSVIPRPAILEGTNANGRIDTDQKRQALKETGYADWYDWSVANWGTKWGTYDFEERERSDGRYVFKFESAWSFPTPVFKKLAEMWPSLVFALVSFDEGGCFGCKGEFNGKNDFRCDEALGSDEGLYVQVYGRRMPKYDENGDEIVDDAAPAKSGECAP